MKHGEREVGDMAKQELIDKAKADMDKAYAEMDKANRLMVIAYAATDRAKADMDKAYADLVAARVLPEDHSTVLG